MKTLVRLVITFIFLLAIISSSVAAQVLYKCGNHSPQHIADNTNEAKQMTNTNGCKGWDVFPATKSVMDDSIRIHHLQLLQKAVGEDKIKSTFEPMQASPQPALTK